MPRVLVVSAVGAMLGVSVFRIGFLVGMPSVSRVGRVLAVAAVGDVFAVNLVFSAYAPGRVSGGFMVTAVVGLSAASLSVGGRLVGGSAAGCLVGLPPVGFRVSMPAVAGMCAAGGSAVRAGIDVVVVSAGFGLGSVVDLLVSVDLPGSPRRIRVRIQLRVRAGCRVLLRVLR